ncbi:MAG: hypothetical protein QOH88_3153 [Verrucomicrobiota bacterium]|jgi:hypothetical protein
MKTIPDKQPVTINSNSAPLAAVISYENPDVVERIAREYHMSSTQAESVFRDTLRFLYLAGATDATNIAPTRNIDAGWHSFLMFTRDYARFCKTHFGKFIHHEPRRRGEAAGGVDRLTLTFDLARQVFGPALSDNWRYDIRSADCESFRCTSKCSPDTGGGGDECTPDSGD